jgi:TonB family protein
MRSRLLAIVCFVLASVSPIAAQERESQEIPLAEARGLYASARYDEALAVLNGMRPDNSAPERKSIEQVRSLCLLALGRGTEAETAIAAVITVDPLFQPSETDASPRVRTAFSEVRQRLLPDLATARYGAAKAAFDRKEFVAAEQAFRAVLQLVDDPQMGGRLGDLRTLASGFLDLSAAAAAPPPPEPKPEPKPEPPPPPVPVREIYSTEDAGVTPPVIIRQELPRVPAAVTAQARGKGLVEIVIDEQGRVTRITMRVSIHPLYDQMLLSSARDWRYQPATFNGQSVKFSKLIQISVEKR